MWKLDPRSIATKENSEQLPWSLLLEAPGRNWFVICAWVCPKIWYSEIHWLIINVPFKWLLCRVCIPFSDKPRSMGATGCDQTFTRKPGANSSDSSACLHLQQLCHGWAPNIPNLNELRYPEVPALGYEFFFSFHLANILDLFGSPMDTKCLFWFSRTNC